MQLVPPPRLGGMSPLYCPLIVPCGSIWASTRMNSGLLHHGALRADGSFPRGNPGDPDNAVPDLASTQANSTGIAAVLIAPAVQYLCGYALIPTVERSVGAGAGVIWTFQ